MSHPVTITIAPLPDDDSLSDLTFRELLERYAELRKLAAQYLRITETREQDERHHGITGRTFKVAELVAAREELREELGR